MKIFTTDELKIVIESHKNWLDGKEEGERADLSDANLSRADLSDANLSRADLSGADLSDADLRRANLRDANLSYTRGRLFIVADCVGSRNARTIYDVSEDIVFCGCYKGSLDQFEERVAIVYKPDTLHYKQYRAVIEYIRTMLSVYKEDVK